MKRLYFFVKVTIMNAGREEYYLVSSTIEDKIKFFPINDMKSKIELVLSVKARIGIDLVIVNVHIINQFTVKILENDIPLFDSCDKLICN